MEWEAAVWVEVWAVWVAAACSQTSHYAFQHVLLISREGKDHGNVAMYRVSTHPVHQMAGIATAKSTMAILDAELALN